MSDNQLAVVNAMFPSAAELITLKDMAQTFIASGLIPKAIDKPEKAIVVMLKGKEAGIPPLQALAHIHVIDGKPGMSAELMLSQLYKNIPGFAHQFTETSVKACRMKVKRPGSDWQDFAFTIEEANTAGLTGKGPWRAYPAAMLRARCLSAMARAVGPDALAGISYTPEELGAEVDAVGNFVSASASGGESGAKVDRLKSLANEPKEVVAEVITTTPEAPKPTVVAQGPKPAEPIGVMPPKVAKVEPKAATEPEPAFDPYADYELQAGHSLKGKKLKDLNRETLKEFLANTREHFKSKGQEIKGAALQDVTRIDDYLRTSEPVASLWDDGGAHL